MITFFTLFLSFIILLAALAAIRFESLPSAIIATGAVSLFSSVLYILLAAPDVAMTEAAISSGLMTALFFMVLGKTHKEDKHG
ncbi:MAG: energy-converting hydrogenase subunit [Candidatus Marinimicrobia bacterium]|jgi:uncharacterized MnhB-related membrane protein|nr:energy-converting hydrogenase subunit [Candidatus Neomarinimicrobiota bacterium]